MTKRWTVSGGYGAYYVRLENYRTTPKTYVRETREEAQQLADRLNEEREAKASLTLLPVIDHPGFSIESFDTAVDRAHRNGLRVTEHVGPVAFVTSASRPGRVHRVTRTSCDCEGHAAYGRCMHRALAIFLADVMGGFGPAPVPANAVAFPVELPQTAA